MSYPPPYGGPPPPYGQPGWKPPPPHLPYPPSDFGQVTPQQPPYPPSDFGQVTPQQPPYPPSDFGQVTPQRPPYPPSDFGQVTPQQPPYPPSDFGQITPQQPPMPIYVPGTIMIPVPVMPQMPQMQQPPPQPDESKPTHITNVYYPGQSSGAEPVQISESSGDYNWVPSTSTTARTSLAGKALAGGREGFDGSPLWVIRAWHNGDLIPGKLSARHHSASVMYGGKEIPVQNIEVLCAKPESIRWVPAANGNVPPGAIVGGKTKSGETLYVGRAKHQLSLTPGKVQRSQKTCYIGFGGAEIAINNYDVLCRIS